jgi:hypothetical protein
MTNKRAADFDVDERIWGSRSADCVVARVRSRVYISYVQHSKQKETLEHRSGWRVAIDLVFPTIATIFIVGVVAGGLAALRQIRNARRDRMEMKRHLREVGLTGR